MDNYSDSELDAGLYSTTEDYIPPSTSSSPLKQEQVHVALKLQEVDG